VGFFLAAAGELDLPERLERLRVKRMCGEGESDAKGRACGKQDVFHLPSYPLRVP
jgi:hypothetical protein